MSQALYFFFLPFVFFFPVILNAVGCLRTVSRAEPSRAKTHHRLFGTVFAKYDNYIPGNMRPSRGKPAAFASGSEKEQIIMVHALLTHGTPTPPNVSTHRQHNKLSLWRRRLSAPQQNEGGGQCVRRTFVERRHVCAPIN